MMSAQELKQDTRAAAQARPAVIAPPVISAQDVDVHYGDKQALSGISLDFPANQVTSLIGPSGCGKTTFLRCINRMNDFIDVCRVDGTIQIAGQDIYDPAVDVVALRAHVGMVFQKPNPSQVDLRECRLRLAHSWLGNHEGRIE